MGKVIWKYTLMPGYNILMLPRDTEFVSARIQGRPFSDPPAVVVWAKQYKSGVDQPYVLHCVNTGNEVPDNTRHIGTCEAENGIIWHVFEEIEEE